MTSPDLIQELRASRPAAPAELRARVRELSADVATPRAWPQLRLPVRRMALVAVPAAAAIAVAGAGVLGFARSDATTEAFPQATLTEKATAESAPPANLGAGTAQDSVVGPIPGRAQRVSATLTVEVADADAVSRAAQDALDLTRSLGGYVVNASVATGTEGSASLTLRVPVARVQDAIVGLSGLGRIVSQQVTVDDLQEQLDALERREASVIAQIARIEARLETESLDAQTEAVLRARLQTLRSELRGLRTGIASTNAEARMSTIQLGIVTPGALGIVTPPSRLDRTIDEALNVLAWEGVIALAFLIVA
ncbi:MAG: hypothetical protein A2Y55_01715, partial [Actinobacteria bacterium RBG_16_68_12]